MVYREVMRGLEGLGDGGALMGLVTLDGSSDWSRSERVAEAADAWRKFLRFMRRRYKKRDGWEYWWVAQVQKRGALHWHFFLTNADADVYRAAADSLVRLEPWRVPSDYGSRVGDRLTYDLAVDEYVKGADGLGMISGLTEVVDVDGLAEAAYAGVAEYVAGVAGSDARVADYVSGLSQIATRRVDGVTLREIRVGYRVWAEGKEGVPKWFRVRNGSRGWNRGSADTWLKKGTLLVERYDGSVYDLVYSRRLPFYDGSCDGCGVRGGVNASEAEYLDYVEGSRSFREALHKKMPFEADVFLEKLENRGGEIAVVLAHVIRDDAWDDRVWDDVPEIEFD